MCIFCFTKKVTNFWTVRTPGTLNGWMKVYHMLIAFIGLIERHTIDHSSLLVRNPLLKVWPPLLFAYRSWGWRLFHWVSDSFAPNCHPFLLWTEAQCTKDVCTELHCLLARRCHTSTSAAHLEHVGPAPWNFREMNMFLPSPFSSWYLFKVLLGSGGWLATKKESYGVTACVTALGPRPSSTVP